MVSVYHGIAGAKNEEASTACLSNAPRQGVRLAAVDLQLGGLGKEVCELSDISNKVISDYLGEQGVYHSKLGYKYLMLSLRALLDGKVDRYRMLSVYEYVAAQSKVTPGQVDRSIRNVVRKTSMPVSNKEFLTRALDDLTLAADADAAIFESPKPN